MQPNCLENEAERLIHRWVYVNDFYSGWGKLQISTQTQKKATIAGLKKDENKSSDGWCRRLSVGLRGLSKEVADQLLLFFVLDPRE